MKKSYSEMSATIVSVSCRNCATSYDNNELTIFLGDPYGLCGSCYESLVINGSYSTVRSR